MAKPIAFYVHWIHVDTHYNATQFEWWDQNRALIPDLYDWFIQKNVPLLRKLTRFGVVAGLMIDQNHLHCYAYPKKTSIYLECVGQTRLALSIQTYSNEQDIDGFIECLILRREYELMSELFIHTNQYNGANASDPTTAFRWNWKNAIPPKIDWADFSPVGLCRKAVQTIKRFRC